MIIFAARSGSTYLTSILNQHDNILCYPELMGRIPPDEQKVLLEAMVRGERAEKLFGRLKIWPICRIKGPMFPFLEIKLLFKRFDYVGLKAQLGQIRDRDKFRSIVEDNQIRIILLSRRNPVATAVSVLNARKLQEIRGKHNARKADHVQGPIHVGKDEFDQLLGEREKAKRRLDRYVTPFNAPIYRCHYEDLLADRDKFMAGLLDFFDLPAEPAEYTDIIFKNTPKRLDQAIVNFEELRDGYRGTEYDKYFFAD